MYKFAIEIANLWRINSKIEQLRVMGAWLTVIICAIVAVGFFVVGMSLTLMIKGHHIESEISTNPEMQRRGIKCAVQESREALSTDCTDTSLCSGNCAGCDADHSSPQHPERL